LLDIYGSTDRYDKAVILSILDTLWTLYKKDGKPKTWWEDPVRQPGQRGRLSQKWMTDGNSPRKVNPMIVDWIESKAQRWGIGETEIVDKIFSFFPRLHLGYNDALGSYYAVALDSVAADLDFTFSDRQKLASKIDVNPRSLERGGIYTIDQWAKEQAKKPVDAQIRLSEYLKLKQDAQEERDRLEEESRQADVERRTQNAQTPQEVHKRKVQSVKEAADRAVWAIQSIEHMISDSAEFAEPIAEAIASLTEFHNEHFKRKSTQLKDRLAANNAKMRKEIKALTAEVESLKRALNAKTVAAPRLPHVVVEHGL
jgi:hypothetical protein